MCDTLTALLPASGVGSKTSLLKKLSAVDVQYKDVMVLIPEDLRVLQALARDAGCNFMNIKASTLQSKWFGETQKMVQAVFTLAYKLQPCIIFIGPPLPFPLPHMHVGPYQAFEAWQQ